MKRCAASIRDRRAGRAGNGPGFASHDDARDAFVPRGERPPEARLRPHPRCGKDRPAFNALDASMCAGAADGTALKLAAVAQW